MADSSPPADRGRDWSRIAHAASLLALAVGTFMLLVGIAVEGPIMLAYTLAGVVPLLLGTVGLARERWAPETASAAARVEPMEALKRRYASGEIEDDELERKVEYLLDADAQGPARSDRGADRTGARGGERERERSAR